MNTATAVVNDADAEAFPETWFPPGKEFRHEHAPPDIRQPVRPRPRCRDDGRCRATPRPRQQPARPGRRARHQLGKSAGLEGRPRCLAGSPLVQASAASATNSGRRNGYYFSQNYGYWHPRYGLWNQARRCWLDLDNNPPGPRGGRGTNWENPPGWKGGPGASPDRYRRCR
jgi:hypothetical protein